MNNSGQNHGEDEKYYSWIMPLLLIITCVLIFSICKNKASPDDNDSNTDWPRIILTFSVWLHLASLSFSFLDHLMYIYGSGEPSVAISFIIAVI